jgi:hypothetical protein
MIRMERYLMKTFKTLLEWKLIQWNSYTSDRITLKYLKHKTANNKIVGIHQLDVPIIALSI